MENRDFGMTAQAIIAETETIGASNARIKSLAQAMLADQGPDVFIPGLPVQSLGPPLSFVDEFGNSLTRLTDPAHVTIANGYHIDAPTHMGLAYVYKHVETSDRKHVIVPMISSGGFSHWIDVLRDGKVIGKIRGQADSMLSNINPNVRYYVAWDNDKLNALHADTLDGSDRLIRHWPEHTRVMTWGERRQSDADTVALMGIRNDGSGCDAWVVNLSDGKTIAEFPLPGWTLNTGGVNDLRVIAISHDGQRVAVGINASTGIKPFPAGQKFVAFLDLQGKVTGQTPDNSYSHGDWVVHADGRQGWCSAFMGQQGADKSALTWFDSNGGKPEVMLDADSTAAACYVSGIKSGYLLVSYGDDSGLYGNDENSKVYGRVIAVRADGSMRGRVRAVQMGIPTIANYNAVCRAVFGRGNEIYVNLGTDPNKRIDMWVSQ